MRSLLRLVLPFLVVKGSRGDISPFDGTIDVDNEISAACLTALNTTIPVCDQEFAWYPTWDFAGPFQNSTSRGLFCSTGCVTSLQEYQANVSTLCADDLEPWDGVPVTYWADKLEAYQSRICLTASNSSDYCVDIITNYTWPDYDVALPDIDSDLLCSECFLGYLQLMQASPYSNYDESWTDDYASAQAICSVSYPTAVQSVPWNATQTLPAGLVYPTGNATTCMSGNYATAATNQSSQEIALANSVSSGTLRILNSIFPDDSNLDSGDSLCLPYSCDTYVVQTNDTCWSVASTYSTTYTLLLSYNPTLNPECANLSPGEIICLSPPSGTFTPTTIASIIATQTSVYAATSVVAPGLVAADTTTDCGRYYQGQDGDDCQQISLSAGISVDLFLELNPSVNANCSNLVPSLYYCVQAVEGWTANSTATTGSVTSVTVSAPGPTLTGTTDSCYTWYTVQSGDTCALIESSYDITFAQFQVWNPSINSACGNLELDVPYCVDGSMASSTTTSTAATTGSIAAATTAAAIIISPNGLCNSTTTCVGSEFGDCCSIYGYCGSTSDYCAASVCASGDCDAS